MVSLIINGKPVCVPEGTSILEAARAANIDIPTLCYLKDLNEIGACRICMVEVEGQDTLVAACDNEVHEGMVVHTNSQKVRMTRRVNLQLLLSQHEVNCVKCTRSGICSARLIRKSCARPPSIIPRPFCALKTAASSACAACRCAIRCRACISGIWSAPAPGRPSARQRRTAFPSPSAPIADSV